MYEPVDLAEAVRILVAESHVEGDEEATAEIATILGREPPALRWAGAIARTIGWRPLRQRIASWTSLPRLVGESQLPWQAEVEGVRASLPAAEAKLLATLSSCDAPFAWDVLDAVEPTASVESICLLEDAGLVTRSTRAGVVTFVVPYCVRAIHRLSDPSGTESCSVRWLEGWVKRTEELRRASYGVSARATLSELVSAVPLAARALFDAAERTQDLGLAVWTNAADAMFFVNALGRRPDGKPLLSPYETVDFGSPAFAQAVAIADARGGLEPRIRARVALGRAILEKGDPVRAAASMAEAVSLAKEAGRDELLSEALRGLGWAQLAAANLDAAKSSFEGAQVFSEAAGDPRGHADASAGLGIRALLTGDVEKARALLAEALATHVVTRDAPREASVRGMMALLPKQVGEPADVAQLTKEVAELRTTNQSWREALVLARLGLAARARGDAEAEKVHFLEARAAAALSSMSASKLVASMVDTLEAAANPIVVGFEGRSLVLPSGESHDLSRHGALRRMLWALAVAKKQTPGASISTLELVELGWPGEKMKHEAATLRVYTTIRRLRALGLADALVTRDEGYLLDPETAVALESA